MFRERPFDGKSLLTQHISIQNAGLRVGPYMLDNYLDPCVSNSWVGFIESANSRMPFWNLRRRWASFLSASSLKRSSFSSCVGQPSAYQWQPEMHKCYVQIKTSYLIDQSSTWAASYHSTNGRLSLVRAIDILFRIRRRFPALGGVIGGAGQGRGLAGGWEDQAG